VLAVFWLPATFWAVRYALSPALWGPRVFTDDMFQIGLNAVATLALLGWVIARSGWSWKVFGIRRFRALDLIGGIVLFSLWLVATRVWFADVDQVSTPFASASEGWHYLLLVGVQLLHGMGEELLYRGYLVKRLAYLLGRGWSAILVSASLFSTIHIYQGTTWAMFWLLVGAGFGVVFFVWKRLWPLAIAHALMNVYSYLPEDL
jgi:membrane protease YdiL (CAAX protease family)